MSVVVKTLQLFYFVGLLALVYSVIISSFLVYIICVCMLYVCMKVIQKQTTGTIKVQGQGVYITGCDTGKYTFSVIHSFLSFLGFLVIMQFLAIVC